MVLRHHQVEIQCLLRLSLLSPALVSELFNSFDCRSTLRTSVSDRLELVHAKGDEATTGRTAAKEGTRRNSDDNKLGGYLPAGVRAVRQTETGSAKPDYANISMVNLEGSFAPDYSSHEAHQPCHTADRGERLCRDELPALGALCPAGSCWEVFQVQNHCRGCEGQR